MTLPVFSYPAIIVALVIAVVYLLWRQRATGGESGKHILELYAKDLTALAKDGKLDPVVGREEEIERVIQVLSRRTKNNPVLIGKPGVGKTAIAEGLARAIVAKKVPVALLDKKVLALDLPGIVAGTKYRGEFEQRLKRISDEITASNRSIILFIDEIHTLAQAGGAEGSIDADDILKPALARGDLQVVGATTATEYKEFIQKDVTLDRRLHPILIDEPTKDETVEILEGIKTRYEKFHKVKITKEAILACVHLSEQHIKDKFFPDKAIDLMDEAASKTRLENMDEQPSDVWPQVGVGEVQAVVKEWLENQLT